MKNRNKIAVNFTQPPEELNCCIRNKKTSAADKDASESTAVQQIKKFVKKITAADVIPSPTSSATGDSDSSNLIRPTKKKTIQTIPLVENTISGLQFYYEKEDITNRIKEFLKQNLADYPDECPVLPIREEDAFREWGLSEREHFKAKQSDKKSPFPGEESDDNSDGKSILTGTQRSRRKINQKINHKNVIKHISGYMYGPFTKQPTPDKLTQDGDKFGIPFTMTDRAKRFYKKRRIQHNVLRRVRLSHMGFEQPPSKDVSSDDESVQLVKKLALIRTPYFIVPTIKISQVKRKDRFRNKFLKKDRLKRINLLMNGTRRKNKNQVADEENIFKQKQSIFAKFFQLTGKKFKQTEEPKVNPDKMKYYKIIKDKYLEHRSLCEVLDQVNIFKTKF